MLHAGMKILWGVIVLKEVGSSGQISLGKKFAGRLFELVVHPGDRFELIPMKVVPHAGLPRPRKTKSVDGWLPPGGYVRCNQWALDNRAALESYAQRVSEHGTAAEQLHAFLVAIPDALTN